MKTLKIFLMLISVAVCPAWKISTHEARNHEDYTGVLLIYFGNIGPKKMSIQFEMVPKVGIRYAVGGTMPNHDDMAIIYKFSQPGQAIYYNYSSHKSEILTSQGSDNDITNPEMTVVGTETLHTFSCTHIRDSHKPGDEYWMSPDVPGFVMLVKTLNAIDPSLVTMEINETIFNWGGLVKSRWTTDDGQLVGGLDLSLANANAQIPASDFEIPKK